MSEAQKKQLQTQPWNIVNEPGNEDKKDVEEKPAWYETWRGILIAGFFIALFYLVNKINIANCNVALLAVVSAYLFLRVRLKVVKIILGLLWLLLLPNTAYLFTDLGHIVYQWNNTVSLYGHMLLFAQYLLLESFGAATFLFSFYPFEKVIDRINAFKKRKVAWLILFNFVVAFGVVLGRFEHINSYVVFTNPLNALRLAINIFVSFDLLGLTIFFGLLCNFIYFLFRGLVSQRRLRNY